MSSSMNEFYKNCAVPKPQDKKKTKLFNGYKDKKNRVCMVRGTAYAERHEIFGGSNRQKSIKYGLQVDLSHEEHERVTNPRTPEDLAFVQELKEYGQKKFEDMMIENEGMTPLEARRTFMFEFGKNYRDMLGVGGY